VPKRHQIARCVAFQYHALTNVLPEFQKSNHGLYSQFARIPPNAISANPQRLPHTLPNRFSKQLQTAVRPSVVSLRSMLGLGFLVLRWRSQPLSRSSPQRYGQPDKPRRVRVDKSCTSQKQRPWTTQPHVAHRR
jgi:hypothetical protein